MKDAIIRWILISLAVLALGPALATLTGIAHDPWGGNATTALQSSAPVLSIGMVVLAIAAAGVFGMFVARMTSIGTGMFCAGAALGLSAYAGATTEGLIRISASARPLWMLSIEAAALGAMTIGVAILILKKRPDRHAKAMDEDEELFGSQAALAAGVSFLVAAIAAWVIAREGLPGQTLAAAGLATMFAIAAGRSVAPSASILCCLSGVLLVGVAGPAIGAMMHGSGVVEASYSGALFPLSRVTPMDWVSGVLLGAPMGSVWAASMIEKNVHGEPARARA